MNSIRLLFVIVLVPFFLKASVPDTLGFNEYFALLVANHPFAKMADIRTLIGNTTFANAQGAFEPTLNADYNRKSFEGKNYYSFFNSEIKIPAWIGEVKAGYDYNYGININPDMIIPMQGQAYVGLSVPLVRYLITDKKRTELRLAKVYEQGTTFERIDMLNTLFVQATTAYWQWSSAFQIYKINLNALELSQKRHQFIISAATFGDRPFIDTIESLTQVQNRKVMLSKSKTDWLKSTYDLSNFLWNTEGNPIIIDTVIIPEIPDMKKIEAALVLDDELNQLTSQPEVNLAQLKVKSLVLERRLKRQELLPRLNANYYLLSNGAQFGAYKTNSAFTERYKFGFEFQMPMLLAQARSQAKLATFKLKEAELSLVAKTQAVNVKVRNYWYDFENTRQQLNEVQQMIINYSKLLEAEQDKFSIGESNVFLINTRENKYVEALEKSYELFLKLYYYEALLYQQSGSLYKKILK